MTVREGSGRGPVGGLREEAAQARRWPFARVTGSKKGGSGVGSVGSSASVLLLALVLASPSSAATENLPDQTYQYSISGMNLTMNITNVTYDYGTRKLSLDFQASGWTGCWRQAVIESDQTCVMTSGSSCWPWSATGCSNIDGRACSTGSCSYRSAGEVAGCNTQTKHFEAYLCSNTNYVGFMPAESGTGQSFSVRKYLAVPVPPATLITDNPDYVLTRINKTLADGDSAISDAILWALINIFPDPIFNAIVDSTISSSKVQIASKALSVFTLVLTTFTQVANPSTSFDAEVTLTTTGASFSTRDWDIIGLNRNEGFVSSVLIVPGSEMPSYWYVGLYSYQNGTPYYRAGTMLSNDQMTQIGYETPGILLWDKDFVVDGAYQMWAWYWDGSKWVVFAHKYMFGVN